ncbi:MAG: hypothetical protein MRJ68_14200 [Nitrospira sp.]|nr:hypothetical protein [Nitrospira sp.]
MFVQMGFDDAIIVDPKPLTDGILSDFKTAIEVTAERGGKEKVNGDHQWFRKELIQ